MDSTRKGARPALEGKQNEEEGENNPQTRRQNDIGISKILQNSSSTLLQSDAGAVVSYLFAKNHCHTLSSIRSCGTA